MYAGVFVAFSRVKKAEHIGILVHKMGDVRGFNEVSLGYLTALKPHKSVPQFYSGYEGNKGKWKWKKALENYF